MEYLKAILLAVVEGITEFLPISSTGHLILVNEYVGLNHGSEFTHTFIVAIQLPAILSVVLYFWRDLWPFQGDTAHRKAATLQWAKICVAFAPAVVFGLLFHDAIEGALSTPTPIAVALIVGGVALIAVERMHLPVRAETVMDIGFRTALFIGLFQCLALIPGTSRSAATIIGAMVLGASRPAAAEFSFFLAIPTMVAATGYTLLKSGASFTGAEWALLGVGSAVSFVVAYGVIAFLMTYIRNHDFKVFGYYRVVLGLVVLLYFMFA